LSSGASSMRVVARESPQNGVRVMQLRYGV
jgi:hypothetical protein